MKKILIIGGGFAGCAMAHALDLSGNYDVLVVEKSNQLGAGVRTYFSGGHPFTAVDIIFAKIGKLFFFA